MRESDLKTGCIAFQCRFCCSSVFS